MLQRDNFHRERSCVIKYILAHACIEQREGQLKIESREAMDNKIHVGRINRLITWLSFGSVTKRDWNPFFRNIIHSNCNLLVACGIPHSIWYVHTYTHHILTCIHIYIYIYIYMYIHTYMYAFCRVLSRSHFRGMIKFYLFQVAKAIQK